MRKRNAQATDWTVKDLNLDPKLPPLGIGPKGICLVRYGDGETLGRDRGYSGDNAYVSDN